MEGLRPFNIDSINKKGEWWEKASKGFSLDGRRITDRLANDTVELFEALE
jgi:hypothetical protein